MNFAQAVFIDENGRWAWKEPQGPSVLVKEIERQPKPPAAPRPYDSETRGKYGIRPGSMVGRVFNFMRTAPKREWDRKTIANRMRVSHHRSVSVACNDLISKGLVEALGYSPRRYRLTEKGRNYAAPEQASEGKK